MHPTNTSPSPSPSTSTSTSVHWCRFYDVAPGECIDEDAGPVPDGTLQRWGAAAAQVDRSLRGFWHPSGARQTLWDVQFFLQIRPFLSYVQEPVLRAVCSQVLNYFDVAVAPKLPAARHQMVHGDLNLGNILWEHKGSKEVSGIIDYGDMSFTSLVVSLAAVLSSAGTAHVKQGGHAELMRMGRLILDGYQSIVTLESEELALLADLWMCRACTEVVLTSWRIATGLVRCSVFGFRLSTAMLRARMCLHSYWRHSIALAMNSVANPDFHHTGTTRTQRRRHSIALTMHSVANPEFHHNEGTTRTQRRRHSIVCCSADRTAPAWPCSPPSLVNPAGRYVAGQRDQH
jgi:Ser/Thr protein kinase RdoA (MazF antagonist)